ncbi:MAG: amidohydrolase, partial [Clostridiales bacterium]|nr:amidohydrolase [Clostridiales bacterium]
QEIDLEGNLLMPSFKNAHTHSAMTFLRSYADDLPLQQWLEQQVFPMEAKPTAPDVYGLPTPAWRESRTSGSPARCDMYSHPDSVGTAGIESGLRTVLCGSVNGDAAAAERLERDYLAYRDCHELVSYQLGFHAEYTASRELMEAIAALAEKYHAPVYTHTSETAAEVDGCLERHGMTPPALFESLGLYAYGGGGFHCVHLREGDIPILKRNGVWAVTNPGSNVKLASGIAPLREMHRAGMPLAIGTDGPASNNCLDMFREMFLTTALQKIDQKDASAMDAHTVLSMAVSGGARCMGLEDCDSLAVGKQADLIVLDLRQPNMQPLNNVSKNIVYSGSKQNVKLTMVNGKILYRDGAFLTIDADETYSRANQIMQRMKENG